MLDGSSVGGVLCWPSIEWEAPWTARLQWKRTDDAIFEYACHEGNVGMEGILAGARADEAKMAASPSR